MENKTHTTEETFVFYPSFIRQIEAIRNDAVKARLYKAAAEYGCYNVVPDFSDIDPIGTLDGLFEAIKYAIDESKSRRRKTSEIRSNAGRLGGAQPGNSNARKKSTEQNEQNEQKRAKVSKTSVNVNVNENVDENKNISTIVDEESKPKRARRFVAPSLDDVKKFFLENGFTSDPAQFYDHYSANGWLIGGKSKMKDWNAAAGASLPKCLTLTSNQKRTQATKAPSSVSTIRTPTTPPARTNSIPSPTISSTMFPASTSRTKATTNSLELRKHHHSPI